MDTNVDTAGYATIESPSPRPSSRGGEGEEPRTHWVHGPKPRPQGRAPGAGADPYGLASWRLGVKHKAEPNPGDPRFSINGQVSLKHSSTEEADSRQDAKTLRRKDERKRGRQGSSGCGRAGAESVTHVCARSVTHVCARCPPRPSPRSSLAERGRRHGARG